MVSRYQAEYGPVSPVRSKILRPNKENAQEISINVSYWNCEWTAFKSDLTEITSMLDVGYLIFQMISGMTQYTPGKHQVYSEYIQIFINLQME